MPPARTIAFLCEFPTLLGGERSLLTFLEHAPPELDPLVVAPRTGSLAERLDQLRIARIGWPWGGVRQPEAVVTQLRRHGVDVVHANSLMTADAAGTLGRLLRVPAVAHVRDMMRLSAARRERLAGLDAVVCVSHAVTDWLVEQGMQRESIRTIYNAVDAACIRASATSGTWRRRLGLDADRHPLIACVGQIALRKGQDVFLEAAALLARRFPKAHFVIAGARYSEKQESREFEAALVARARATPLAGRAHLVGYVDEVAALLADTDVLVVASRQEPLSRVLLEGLAQGVPAVATAVGGTAEIVGTPPVALTVPPDDPRAIAAAVRRLLEDPTLASTLREIAPRHVEARFSVARQVRALKELYDNLLHSSRR